MKEPFAGFDFTAFWRDDEWALKEYVDLPPAEATVAAVEKALGYKLPAAYVALARQHNGGTPWFTCHRTSQATSWAENHVAIAGIFSIGATKPCSLLGSVGSNFWPSAWGYPSIGVYFADCPSAGHDMLCLDYRDCGPTGEPRVVHVDQELDYTITHVADDFESFIRGLERSASFDLGLANP